MSRSRRIYFVVQGEGRGHMTQALALQRMFVSGGHEVVGCSVGAENGIEDIPGFFVDGMEAPVSAHPSQPFVRDRKNEGIRLGRTVWHAALNYPRMNRGAAELGDRIASSRADAIVNLYDPIASVLSRRMRPKLPLVVVGHQFLMQHPSYVYPPGLYLSRLVMRVFNSMVSSGASQRWALSYYEEENQWDQGLIVLPPVLRDELFGQPLGRDQGYLLVYMLNAGYLSQLSSWHERRPEIPVHCFCKRPGAPETETLNGTLVVHQLGEEFLRYMASCRGVVCSSGFESVAEALYFGKPAYMIPTGGHYEQLANAHDAQRHGVGLHGRAYDLDHFLAYIDDRVFDTERYREWLGSATDRVLQALDRLPGPAGH